MAKRTHVELTDDIDESDGPAVRTVTFAWMGTDYEIDLNEPHREEFALAVGRYLQYARSAKSKAGKSRSRTEAQRAGTKAIRSWAITNGHNLSDKGRIPAKVIDAYWDAMKETTGTENSGQG